MIVASEGITSSRARAAPKRPGLNPVESEGVRRQQELHHEVLGLEVGAAQLRLQMRGTCKASSRV
eukprot:COSAG05_NODE_10228_length_576_cov_1.480084_1_plen_65_part_00